ncbi:MAG: endonuclease/exonuclease/phosphatase family protein, partial [Bacteroidota bacterium]|nr:endonuclease/exonuclease/phosphatase family protein [Bacteroidota bacterium]
MKKPFFIIPALIIVLNISAQETELKQNRNKNFTIVFYNIENLFDFEDDPLTMDEDFTPGSEKKWDKEKYLKKTQDISKVLSSIGKRSLPAIIGLAEVENEKVLIDLINTENLKKGNYGIVHYDSPDKRGIDVAILYRKDLYKIESHKSIPINFPRDTILTRDILMVKGKTNDSENLFVFVNHWKSRSGGMAVTEHKRNYSAVVLRKAVDSILNFEPKAKIIILGDFNDEPTNRSIHQILQANNKRKNRNPRDLYNLMYDMHNLGDSGTYHYSGSWNMLDQIIVSQALLDTKQGYSTDFGGGKIYN